MAFDIVRTKSLLSTNAIASQFVFVAVDSANANSVVLPTAGAEAIGVIQDTPNAGDPTAICYPGDITKCLCGASAISIGQDVSTDANGNAIPAASGLRVLGTALSLGSPGFLFELLFQPKGVKESA